MTIPGAIRGDTHLLITCGAALRDTEGQRRAGKAGNRDFAEVQFRESLENLRWTAVDDVDAGGVRSLSFDHSLEEFASGLSLRLGSLRRTQVNLCGPP
jgi:hypothetical protein